MDGELDLVIGRLGQGGSEERVLPQHLVDRVRDRKDADDWYLAVRVETVVEEWPRVHVRRRQFTAGVGLSEPIPVLQQLLQNGLREHVAGSIWSFNDEERVVGPRRHQLFDLVLKVEDEPTRVIGRVLRRGHQHDRYNQQRRHGGGRKQEPAGMALQQARYAV